MYLTRYFRTLKVCRLSSEERGRPPDPSSPPPPLICRWSPSSGDTLSAALRFRYRRWLLICSSHQTNFCFVAAEYGSTDDGKIKMTTAAVAMRIPPSVVPETFGRKNSRPSFADEFRDQSVPDFRFLSSINIITCGCSFGIPSYLF